MRIAVTNSYPNHAVVAETELIQRILIAGCNLGWEMREVVTSDDIAKFAPDCVLATHFNHAKLTPFLTLGAMYNPPEYFATTPAFVRNVLTYDGFLPGSPTVIPYLRDLAFAAGRSMPIADFPFAPTTHRTEWVERLPGPRTLFYVGTRWDTPRHGTLLERVNQIVPFHVYGPAHRWAGIPCDYRGEIPADGRSVLDKIREAGIALCIHSREHRRWNLPSMRVFEAAAAGAVIIADRMPLLDEAFGDSILHIDLHRPEEEAAEQIAGHVHWINANPEKAEAMARDAHAIFNKHFSLEDSLARLPRFLETIRAKKASSRSRRENPPQVEYILRLESVDDDVQQTLQSLVDQSYANIGLVILHPESTAPPDLGTLASRFASCRFVPARTTADGLPSLWPGLARITAPYFGCIDAGTLLQPDHTAILVDLLGRSPALGMACAAAVERRPTCDGYFLPDCFQGPLGKEIRELRRLLPPESYADLADWPVQPIASRSWLARSQCLHLELLEDPALEAHEELHLTLLLQKFSRVASTGQPTCEVTFRQENASSAVMNSLARIRQRCHNPSIERPSKPPVEVKAIEPLSLHVLEVINHTTASEWRVLMRFAKLYLTVRGCAKLLRRPLRLPRRAFKAATILIRQGPRRLLGTIAQFGR